MDMQVPGSLAAVIDFHVCTRVLKQVLYRRLTDPLSAHKQSGIYIIGAIEKMLELEQALHHLEIAEGRLRITCCNGRH
jgi:hypothetical protein